MLYSEENNATDYTEVEVLDPFSNPRFSTGFQDAFNIDPTNYPIVSDDSLNEIQRTLKILEHYGYQSKVFCKADINNFNLMFEVKSDKWNWIVSPVKSENIKQIPSVYIKAIGILLSYNIEINSIACAKPQPQESIFDIIDYEEYQLYDMLKKTLIYPFYLIALCLKITKGLTITTESITSPTFASKADPVLLVRIENIWIEIGRWE